MHSPTGIMQALAIGAAAVLPAVAAQGWVSLDDGSHARPGAALEVRVLPRGDMQFRRGDAVVASLSFFYWRDAWKYERLASGELRTPPAVRDDGSLLLEGLWGTSDGAAPLAYAMVLSPRADGVHLRLTLRKTAPLSLTAGVWAVLTVPRQPDDGRLLFLEPGAHAPVGRPVEGPFRRFLVGVPGDAAAVVAPLGRMATGRSRLSEAVHAVEICLQRRDLAIGETAEVALLLAEAPMPTPPPDPAGPSRQPLALRLAEPLPAQVPLYAPVEIRLDLRGTWDNPYDPDDVRLDAEVVTASGRRLVVPGFFMVPHQREVSDGIETMLPSGPGEWRVRLAASELGLTRWSLRATDRQGSAVLDLPPVTVVPSDQPGFIRVSRVDPRYLVYEAGGPFVPIGHNLPIYPTSGQLVDEALERMAQAGENINRWWMSRSGLGLEWEPVLGRYRQTSAARLDFAFELARHHGFAYMLCMDTHQDFRREGWAANPFNAVNGGPCAVPQDWFTSKEARDFYRKRLRYTVARWSYSANLLCWEFGNEFEGWENTDRAAILAWHQEMSAFLRDLDPYAHPITTSWWSKTGPPEFWELPHIDIVQTHCYTNNDGNVAEQVREYCLHQWKSFEKPHIFGEFGIRSHDTTADKDPAGWALHNAFWAALASGCNGVPWPWWHENYIDPLNLYFHFTAIRAFADGLPFGTERWRHLDCSPEYPSGAAAPAECRDVVLIPAAGFRRRAVNHFVVQPDGTTNDRGEILGLLHGSGHADLRHPPTFEVDFPAAGQFIIDIGRVSNAGLLRVFVDDVQVLERPLPCGEGHGKSWQHRPQWSLWESTYDESVAVSIPAGRHRIRVVNDGKDWIDVKRYTFTGCLRVLRPNLLCAGMAAETQAILWVQNRESTWYNHAREAVPEVRPAVLRVLGLSDGPYDLQWWETWQGRPTGTQAVAVRDGLLLLDLPSLRTDTAARLRRR